MTVDAEPRTTLLRAVGVERRRGRNAVLRGVDLDVAEGEVVAVLGPNGAGKSTLLQTLSGLERPDGGQVERHGRVALALQSPDLARRSVRANVELGLAWWGVRRRDRRERASEALEAMHAGHLARRPARKISGGEQRRVHLARAVAVRPDVLLLDEPFAGLDAATRADLLDDTETALRAYARAVVVVVHERAEAWALADRLVVLIDGRVAAEGAPRDVLEQPPTAEVARFLGFSGEVREGDHALLTRPSQVLVDRAGDRAATVERVIQVEDGARVLLRLETGRAWALVPFPPPHVGDEVRVRVVGGVRFPVSALGHEPDRA